MSATGAPGSGAGPRTGVSAATSAQSSYARVDPKLAAQVAAFARAQQASPAQRNTADNDGKTSTAGDKGRGQSQFTTTPGGTSTWHDGDRGSQTLPYIVHAEGAAIEDELMPWEARVVPRREKIAEWLAETGMDKFLDLIQITFSIASCCLYVIQTYDEALVLHRNDWLLGLEVVMSSFFFIDYLLGLFLAEKRVAYMISVYGIIDLVTILPVFVAVIDSDGWEFQLGILRFVRVLRALRILRVYRVLHFSERGYKHQQLLLIFTMSSLVFCATGIVQAVESSAQDLPFHRAFYFVVITVTTVGYGDIKPETVLGQMTIVVLLCVTAYLVPKQLARLRSFQKSDAAFKRFSGELKHGHVLLCGALDLWSIEMFLREFYHRHHGRQLCAVCIMGAHLPSKALKVLLRQRPYNRLVVYLQGTVHNPLDLERAQVARALAAFIISPPPLFEGATAVETSVPSDDGPASTTGVAQRSVVENDSAVLLAAMSLRVAFPHLDIYAQVSLPENSPRLSWVIGRNGHALSTASLKYKLIARNILCPGSLTLLTNLLNTQSPPAAESAIRSTKYGAHVDAGSGGGGDDTEASSRGTFPTRTPLGATVNPVTGMVEAPADRDWHNEYQHGAAYEVYPMVLSHAFEGLRFDLAAVAFFEQFGCLLFAMDVHEASGRGLSSHVVLFPRACMLHVGDLCYVLATSRVQVEHMVAEFDARRSDALATEHAKSLAADAAVAGEYHSTHSLVLHGGSSGSSSRGSLADGDVGAGGSRPRMTSQRSSLSATGSVQSLNNVTSSLSLLNMTSGHYATGSLSSLDSHDLDAESLRSSSFGPRRIQDLGSPPPGPDHPASAPPIRARSSVSLTTPRASAARLAAAHASVTRSRSIMQMDAGRTRSTAPFARHVPPPRPNRSLKAARNRLHGRSILAIPASAYTAARRARLRVATGAPRPHARSARAHDDMDMHVTPRAKSSLANRLGLWRRVRTPATMHGLGELGDDLYGALTPSPTRAAASAGPAHAAAPFFRRGGLTGTTAPHSTRGLPPAYAIPTGHLNAVDESPMSRGGTSTAPAVGSASPRASPTPDAPGAGGVAGEQADKALASSSARPIISQEAETMLRQATQRVQRLEAAEARAAADKHRARITGAASTRHLRGTPGRHSAGELPASASISGADAGPDDSEAAAAAAAAQAVYDNSLSMPDPRLLEHVRRVGVRELFGDLDFGPRATSTPSVVAADDSGDGSEGTAVAAAAAVAASGGDSPATRGPSTSIGSVDSAGSGGGRSRSRTMAATGGGKSVGPSEDGTPASFHRLRRRVRSGDSRDSTDSGGLAAGSPGVTNGHVIPPSPNPRADAAAQLAVASPRVQPNSPHSMTPPPVPAGLPRPSRSALRAASIQSALTPVPESQRGVAMSSPGDEDDDEDDDEGESGASGGAAASATAAASTPVRTVRLAPPPRANDVDDDDDTKTTEGGIRGSGHVRRRGKGAGRSPTPSEAGSVASVRTASVFDTLHDGATPAELNRRDRPPEAHFFVRRRMATVRQITRNSLQHISGHVLICGDASHCHYIVPALRRRTHPNPPHIVLLHTSPPTPAVWRQLRWFPGIWYVHGSAADPGSLQRAGAPNATHVLVLKITAPAGAQSSAEGADRGGAQGADPTTTPLPPVLHTVLAHAGGTTGGSQTAATTRLPSGGSASTLDGVEGLDFDTLMCLLAIKTSTMTVCNATVRTSMARAHLRQNGGRKSRAEKRAARLIGAGGSGVRRRGASVAGVPGPTRVRSVAAHAVDMTTGQRGSPQGGGSPHRSSGDPALPDAMEVLRSRRGSVAAAAAANQPADEVGDWAGIPDDVRRCLEERLELEKRLGVAPPASDLPSSPAGAISGAARIEQAAWRDLDLLPFSTADLRHAPNVRFVVPCLCVDASGTVQATPSFVHTPSRMSMSGTSQPVRPPSDIHAAADAANQLRARLSIPLHYPSMDPAFAAGHVVSERMLVTVAAQAFYKPHLLGIVDALLAAPVLGHSPLSGMGEVLPERVGGQDRADATAGSDFTDGPAFPLPSASGMGAPGLGPGRFEDDLFMPPEPAVLLSSVAVPAAFVGRKFMYLFAHFTLVAMLPVALHRSRRAVGSPLPYVYTCPTRDTIVHANDRVIVLSAATHAA